MKLINKYLLFNKNSREIPIKSAFANPKVNRNCNFCSNNEKSNADNKTNKPCKEMNIPSKIR